MTNDAVLSSPMWWRREAMAPAATAVRTRVPGIAFAAVVAFTGVLFLSPQSWIPGLRHLRCAFVAAAIAAGSLLWEHWKNRTAPTVTREMSLCFILLAWSVMTVPVSYWPGGSVATLTQFYIKAVVVFWLIANVVTTRARLQTLAVVLMLCTFPLAITGIYNFMTGKFVHDTDAIARIVGYEAALTTNPNDLALTLNLLLPIAIAMFLNANGKWKRALCLAVIVVDVIGVIATFSRAGFLGLAAIAVAYFFQMIRRRGVERAWALLAVVAALMAIPMLPSTYLDRVAAVTNVDSDATGSSRMRWLGNVAAAHFVIEHPILGAGAGMDLLALNQIRRDVNYKVHNVYLQYAVDLGLPGFVLFVLLLTAVYRGVRSARKNLTGLESERNFFFLVLASEISVLVFAISGLFYPVAYQFYFYYIGGVAVAATTITRRELTAPAIAA